MFSACQFSATLEYLKNIQNETQITLEKNSENLKGLKELIETKSKDIQHIINDFNERLGNLKK